MPPLPPLPLHLGPDYLGVDLGHAVDGVGADDAEVSHVDPLGAPLLDQRHAPQPVHIGGEEGGDVLQGGGRGGGDGEPPPWVPCCLPWVSLGTQTPLAP